MAKQRNYLKFKQGFGISDLKLTVAETEANLPSYYIGKDQYVDRAINREDLTSVFIGPKGTGKSAVLQMVRCHASASGNENRVIDLSPDDLAFRALSNIDARTPFLETPSQNRWLFTSLWDYVLSIEILTRELSDQGAINWTAPVF
jgi:hypothetical protein